MFQKKNRVLIAAMLILSLGIPISAISMGVKASMWSPLVSGVELTVSGNISLPAGDGQLKGKVVCENIS